MKIAVLLLIIVNGVVWFYAGGSSSGPAMISINEGRLPRVSALEIVPAKSSGNKIAQSSKGPDKPGNNNGEQPKTDDHKESDACVVVGWFDSFESASHVVENADVVPDDSRVVAVEQPAPPYHWVIIAPASSREKALEHLRKIQQRGIDSYLVTEGPKINAISLGLFESLEAAEKALSRSQSQGLEATLATFPRNQIRYALVFKAKSQLGENSFREVRQEIEGRFSSVTFRRCEGVATTQKNP